MGKPLVSVCLITYNHVKYIKEAIDGVLMQKVNFPWDLIIADDFSTDGTREIILTYKEKYPDFIKLILQEKNVGAAQNWFDLLAAPSSKYIAYFEGDDYWTDPHKLQKQVGFLESHPDFVMCIHPVEIRNDEGLNSTYPYDQAKKVSTIEDVIRGHFIPTLSLMFRNGIIHSFPQWFYKIRSGDIALELLLAQHGKIYCFAEKMGIYRQHSGGSSKTLSHKLHGEKSKIRLFKEFNKYTNYVYEPEIKKRLTFLYQSHLSQINQHAKGFPRYYHKLATFIDFNLTIFPKNIREVKKRCQIFFPQFFAKTM